MQPCGGETCVRRVLSSNRRHDGMTTRQVSSGFSGLNSEFGHADSPTESQLLESVPGSTRQNLAAQIVALSQVGHDPPVAQSCLTIKGQRSKRRQGYESGSEAARCEAITNDMPGRSGTPEHLADWIGGVFDERSFDGSDGPLSCSNEGAFSMPNLSPMPPFVLLLDIFGKPATQRATHWQSGGWQFQPPISSRRGLADLSILWIGTLTGRPHKEHLHTPVAPSRSHINFPPFPRASRHRAAQSTRTPML